MMQQDGRTRVANQERLRQLKREHGRTVQIMSSHDVSEFERAAQRALGERLRGHHSRALWRSACSLPERRSSSNVWNYSAPNTLLSAPAFIDRQSPAVDEQS
jgi:hypothetical protein